MTLRKLSVLLICAALVIALLVWLGSDYRDEARAFLRALLRAI